MTRTADSIRPLPRPRLRLRSGLIRGLKAPSTIVGLVVVALVFATGLLAPVLAPYSPYAQVFDAFLPPSRQHLIGTDEFGRDLFSRVLYGIRQDAIVCLIAVPIGALVGTLLGLVGSVAGWLDTLLQRTFDVTLAFASVIMGVTIAAIIGPGLHAVIVTVALVNIPLFGRLTRSAVKSQAGRDYVTAARVVGVGPVRVLFRHILPNSLDALIVQAALSMSLAVFLEGAMSFVGIGVLPPEPSLGALLRTSTNFLSFAPAYALAPMVVVTVLVLSFNLIGDGLNKGLLRR